MLDGAMPPDVFVGPGPSVRTRNLCLELATGFLQSDNANVFEIDKQCDLTARSVQQE